MIANIMNVLGFADEDNTSEDNLTRRAYPRRVTDKCIGIVNGQAMPVLDWSPGGLRVFGDARPYNLGQEIDVTLKFHMDNTLVDVQHKAQVVRKSAEVFAVQFAPLTSEIRKTFQHVIDSFNAEEFANSQASV